MVKCNYCGEEDVTFTCNYCENTFCSDHRLPEAHDCPFAAIADAQGKERTSRSATDFSRTPTIGHERKRYDRAEGKRGPEIEGDVSEQDDEAEDELPRCNECGDVYIGSGDRCPDCREAKTNETARDGSLASRSTVVSDENASGGRTWREWLLAPVTIPIRVLQYSLGLVRNHIPEIVVLSVVAIVVISFLPGVSLLGALPGPVGGVVNNTTVPAVGNPADVNATDAPRRSDTAGVEPTTDQFEKRVEVAIHDAVNEARRNESLSALRHDGRLRSIARDHSEVMAEEHDIFHDGPDGTMESRYDRHGYQCEVRLSGNRYATGSENVAKNWYRTPVEASGVTVTHDTVEELASSVVTQWLTSPGHRENMLKPYWQNEGIGVEVVVEDGNYAVYVTQNFC